MMDPLSILINRNNMSSKTMTIHPVKRKLQYMTQYKQTVPLLVWSRRSVLMMMMNQMLSTMIRQGNQRGPKTTGKITFLYQLRCEGYKTT